MKPSTNSAISALRSAIQKKKQVGLDMIKEKVDKQKAAKAAAKASAEKEKRIRAEREKEKWEIQALKKELRDVNLENAKYMDRSNLKYPLLYNTREEIMEILRKDNEDFMNYKGRIDLLNELDCIFNDNVTEDVAQLMYIWYEDPESGDPLDAVYGILYDGYIPKEEDCDDDSDDECTSHCCPCLCLRINGKGTVLEESIEDNWVKLSRRHDAQGYVTIHAK